MFAQSAELRPEHATQASDAAEHRPLPALAAERLRDMGYRISPRGMIAEPLASCCEEGAKRPPRVVIFPNSKVLSSSRGVPAPAVDPTSRNRGHDRSSARPESDLP